jgi:hypothetical protein
LELDSELKASIAGVEKGLRFGRENGDEETYKYKSFLGPNSFSEVLIANMRETESPRDKCLE